MSLGLKTKSSEAPPATFAAPSVIKDIDTYSIKEGTIVDISIAGAPGLRGGMGKRRAASILAF